VDYSRNNSFWNVGFDGGRIKGMAESREREDSTLGLVGELLVAPRLIDGSRCRAPIDRHGLVLGTVRAIDLV